MVLYKNAILSRYYRYFRHFTQIKKPPQISVKWTFDGHYELIQRRLEVLKMNELMETLKKFAGKRREISLIEIRKYDNDYEEAMDRTVNLRDQYEAMHLKPEEKQTIDALLDALDDVEVTQVDLSYLAGLADCLLILDRLQLIQL
jgi:hypothetical protein